MTVNEYTYCVDKEKGCPECGGKDYKIPHGCSGSHPPRICSLCEHYYFVREDSIQYRIDNGLLIPYQVEGGTIYIDKDSPPSLIKKLIKNFSLEEEE